MTDGVRIGWFVPVRELSLLLDLAEEERGDRERYAAFYIENAMIEFMDDDRAADLETMLNELIEAGGYTLADLSEKEKSLGTGTVSDLRKQETKQINHLIDPGLRERFMAYSKEETEFGTSYGLALGYAIREYRTNRRVDRMIEKYDRVGDDLLQLINAFGDGSDADTLSTVEKRTIDFCAQMREMKLTKMVGKRDLREDIIGKRYTSEETIDQYEERITDRLDLVEHPDNPALYTHEEHAEQLCQETAEAEASEEMATLMNAAYATDGGEDI